MTQAQKISRKHIGQTLTVTNTLFGETFTLTVERVGRREVGGTYTYEGKTNEGLFVRKHLVIA